jgi:hypothetical protein
MRVQGYRRSTNETPIEGELIGQEGREYVIRKDDNKTVKVRKIIEINDPNCINEDTTTTVPTINENNIYQKGMLIRVVMGGYSGRKRLDSDQLQDLPKEIVRGVHDLFGKEFKEMLRQIDRHGSEARHDVTDYSISFPIEGVYFVPSNKIGSIIEKLEKRKEERAELVKTIVENYEEAIKNFQEKYPEFYRRAKHKYLTKEQLASRFYFKYQFVKIQPPSGDDIEISPEMYKAEMNKFRDTINEMKQEVLSTIYEELLSATERIKNQCTEGKPNQRTLNNLNIYLDRIKEVYSDFIDRADIKEAIKKIKAQVLGVNADALRDSEELKKKFGEEVGKLAREIKALPDIPLKRALEL